MGKHIIDPKVLSTAEFHGYMLSAVAPRPIAFASTVDKAGNVNLSPFSFFNAFSANPPVLIFSPARRVRDNTIKHTLENVYEVPEVCINIVNFDMVQQMSLASTEYDKGINEFIKSGLTPGPSKKIRPPAVKEAPVNFECKVIEIKPLGKNGGAGNLIICEVLLMHISQDILSNEGKIIPNKLDAVARMGGNWYARAHEPSLFEVEKPIKTKGVGIDSLPEHIRNSSILTGNDLGKLGNIQALPDAHEVLAFQRSKEYEELLNGKEIDESFVYIKAKELLNEGEVGKAILLLHSLLN